METTRTSRVQLSNTDKSMSSFILRLHLSASNSTAKKKWLTLFLQNVP